MKIVDEKGKLFGKLNIIDLLVILLVVAAVVLVGIKLMGKGGVSGGAGTTLTYTVVVRGVPQAAYDNMKSYVEAEGGDQLMANGDMLNGYVTGMTEVPHDSVARIKSNANGEKVEFMLDADTLDVTFTITAQVTNPVTNEVGTQEVRIGKTHIVKTVHFEFMDGIITDCEWETLG